MLCNIPLSMEHFYPRPPRGGRHDTAAAVDQERIFLSTPSARRATRDSFTELDNGGFLSTPSARRATYFSKRRPSQLRISIHALREEGDRPALGVYSGVEDFYPRPPRGGRRKGCADGQDGKKFLSTPSARRATVMLTMLFTILSNFYPRPPRGGRHVFTAASHGWSRFLSTPSARRATLARRRSAADDDISIHALREEGDLCFVTFR